MKVLLSSRTGNEMDWTRDVIELHRFPCVGEYIKVPARDGEANHHEVRMVVQVAGVGEVTAEIYCNKLGPTVAHTIGWKNTMTKAIEPEAADPEMPNSAVLPAQDAAPQGEWLTIQQAADIAEVSERTIRRLINDKRLEAIMLGTLKRPNWRITPEALKNIKTATPPMPRIRRQRRPVAALTVDQLITAL